MRTAVFVCLAVILAGCGPALYKVTGRIVKDGEPAIPKAGHYYQIGFFPIEAGGPSTDGYPANRGREYNSFSVPGKTGQGIPPGKYRISIRETDTLGRADLLEGRFGNENSPIIREINSSDELVIDLTNPAG